MNYLDPEESEEERRQEARRQEQRQRLAETYAGMTDAELQNLARRPASLTEVAWAALDDELDRRNLKLNVRVADVENARKILDEPILEGLYVQGVGLYEQPRCPKCQSLDVNFQELDRPIAYISAFLRLPIPVQRPAWRCHGCDAEWEDESD